MYVPAQYHGDIGERNCFSSCSICVTSFCVWQDAWDLAFDPARCPLSKHEREGLQKCFGEKRKEFRALVTKQVDM